MNKKLIERHDAEVRALNEQLREAREELYTKRNKLDKYHGVVKDFQD